MTPFVILTKVRIQGHERCAPSPWVPAFAGMTERVCE